MEHGLDTEVIAVFTVALVLWSLVSARLDRLSITPAVAFVAIGMIVANPPLSLIDINAGSHTVRSIAEITLAVVLFTDAARIDVRKLRADASGPARLLFIGLPLTVAAGVGLGLVMFSDLDPWACAVIASAVAPTDAALGAPLMADRRIPARIRQTLNVESGLNDGLITPIVTFFIAGAAAEAGTEVELSPGSAVADLAIGLLVGAGVGVVGGILLRTARRRQWMEGGVEAVAVGALALLAYAAALEAGGNGFVAAFVGGMAFAVSRRQAPEVLEFASQIGELLASVVWFLFGAFALSVLADGTWSVAVYAVLALTLARMIPVALALAGTGMDRSTVAFVGWFGPRGLASVVFALIAYDELAADPDGTTVLAAVTGTVLLSVVAHGLTARPLAGRYVSATRGAPQPAQPEPQLRPTLGRRRPTEPTP